MNGNKRYFLDFLLGTGDVNVLFEPYIDRENAETIIWRRGEQLWNTPQEYIKTKLSLAERTHSDVLFCDMNRFTGAEKIKYIETLRKFILHGGPLGTCVICHSQEEVDDVSDIADCVAIYGSAKSSNSPVIRMDGSIEDAISRGDSGWFARDNAEYYLKKYGDRIRILGGIGADFINSASPLKIHSTVERISMKYKGKWACGSGGSVAHNKYLELATLLGAFARIR